MKTLSKGIASLATGLLLSLGSGPMALADDTELFVANADPTVTGAQPNILFVVDTSGSMTNKVITQVAWDPDTEFDDCYESDALYFSVTGAQPGCGSNNYIWKTANRCEAMGDALDHLAEHYHMGHRYRAAAPVYRRAPLTRCRWFAAPFRPGVACPHHDPDGSPPT